MRFGSASDTGRFDCALFILAAIYALYPALHPLPSPDVTSRYVQQDMHMASDNFAMLSRPNIGYLATRRFPHVVPQ